MRALILFFIFCSSSVLAQFFPENGVLYTADEIPKIHISIDVDSLEELYLEENWYSDYHYQAQFVFETQTGFDTLNNVGFRFRGNTSRDKIKKSFKVSFNTYEPGRKFHGVEKLNLNAETNDPSMLRSRLCWDLFRDLGVAASRSNHVEVYVNGDYYGLYQNVEHIDEEFTESRFGNNSGNLYKCSYPANLDFISNNPNDYKLAPWGTRTYELKTNTELDDYSKLADFIGFLNQSSDADFRCDFQDYFNVSDYLKIAAIDVLTGNWDGYIFNNNNFYLYENPLTGRMEYIPYDLDNTWGIDWLQEDWASRNIYSFNPGNEPRPLFTRLMEQVEFRDIFTWHVQNMLDNYFNTAEHRAAIESLQDFISSSALADPYRPLDFGFDNEDFLNALNDASGAHVQYSVFGYADTRTETAADDLESVDIAPVFAEVEIEYGYLPDVWEVIVYFDGPDAALSTFSYSINGVNQDNIEVVPDENMATFSIDLPQGVVELDYNIEVTGLNALSRSAFCQSKTVVFNKPNPQIVINELMASNQSVISDENGDYADWIELYNSSEVAVNLSKYYLSDNNSAPFKWQLPDVTMNPGGYLLLWADNDPEEGPLHTNFNISAQGENIFLFRNQSDVLTLIDWVDMPAIPANYSYGREVDAALNWINFSVPTPNATNQIIDGLAELNSVGISVFPNPTTGMIYFSQFSEYRLSDLSGRSLIDGKSSEIDLSSFAEGVYLLNLNGITLRVLKN